MKKYVVVVKEVSTGFELMQELIEAASQIEAKKIATRNNSMFITSGKHIVKVITKQAYLEHYC